jgi:alpha-L-fucosidase 2
MFLQSHTGEIELLPAHPQAWKTGHVKGLRGRDGFEVDIYWKNGTLDKAMVKSIAGGECRVRYGERVVEFETETGANYELNNKLQVQGG